MFKRALQFLVFALVLSVFTPASQAQNVVTGTNILCDSSVDAMIACAIDWAAGWISGPNPWAGKGECVDLCQWVTSPDSPYSSDPTSSDDDYLRTFKDEELPD
jgi:hypothetical protein